MDGAQSVDGKTEGTAGPGDAAGPCRVAGHIYRIVETTGLDGKKLLKLLPLSKTLGNAAPSIHSPVVFDSTKVDASSLGPISLKTVFSNTTTFPGKLQRELNKLELVKVTAAVNVDPNITKVPAIQHNSISPEKQSFQKDAASISSVNSNALMNRKSLPATDNSSELSLRHHLQIPSYAEVKLVPAFCLPPPIQQKILPVAATNASVTSEAAKPLNVIYVSPVKTVKLPVSKCLQNTSLIPAEKTSKPFVLTAAQTPVNNSGLNAVTCNSQKTPEAPMKWVVQENTQTSAFCLVPVKSSNDMASKVLKTLVDKKVQSNPASILPASSDSRSKCQTKLISVKDNALEMHSGKVYLVTKTESSTGSVQDKKQVTLSADTHFRKQTSHLPSLPTDDTITDQVVNLVLSKNKGIALSAKDSKWSELNKNLEVAPILSRSPHGNLQITCTSQQEPLSASEYIPLGINVEDKKVTEEIIPKTAAALSSTNHGVSKEEPQKMLGKLESDIKRKAKLPEPMLEHAKKRRILGLSLPHEHSVLVMDNPSGPCRQVELQEENPTNSLPFPLSGGTDSNPCVQSNGEREVLGPALHSINNETSFSSYSHREDSFLFSPPDLEETIKDEKIERLKLLLRKQEAALEEMRKKMQET